MHLDAKTQQLEQLLLTIAKVGQENGKQYYIGGGFAVDLAFGGLTRQHEDLDFYPREEDTNWWQDWFRTQGYTVSKDTDMEPLPNAFAVLNHGATILDADKDRNYLVDAYPIAVAADGSISMAVRPGTTAVWDGMLTIQGERGLWPGKSWSDIQHIQYKGQAIDIEHYRSVLEQKLAYIRLHPGERLAEKHLLDFERAGIQPDA